MNNFHFLFEDQMTKTQGIDHLVGGQLTPLPNEAFLGNFSFEGGSDWRIPRLAAAENLYFPVHPSPKTIIVFIEIEC